MAIDLGTAFGRVIINSDTRGLTRAGSSLGLFSSKTIALTAAVFGIAGAVGSTVAVATSFEQGIADLGAVSGATAQEIGTLREQALSLGASSRFSAREVVQAQTELSKAGLSAAQVQGAIAGSLALAAAGNVELADAAKFSANALGLFSLDASQATHVADAFAQAANSTTADVGDFGAALQQGGASARAAGFNFDETLVVLEALAKAGVRNSDAGTSMKSALTQLAAPTKKSIALQKELGLSVLDSNGEIAKAPELSARLIAATEGMTAAEKLRTLTVLAGTDGQRALLALINAGPATLKRYAGELTQQGKAAEVAAKRQDSLAGASEQLSGAIESLQIRVGSKLIPVLRDGAVALTGFVTSLTKGGSLEGVGTALASGLDSAGQAVVRLTSSGSGLVSALGGPLLSLAHDALPVLGSALDATVNVLGGAIPVVATFAGGLLLLGQGILVVAAPLVSFVDTVTGIPGVVQVATGALLGLGAAFVVVRTVTLVQGLITVVTAAIAMAGAVGTAAAATTTLATVAPSLGAAITLATGPIGIAVVAVGALAGAVVALSSGMFAGASPAAQLAAAQSLVASSGREAASALQAFDDALLSLQGAQITAAQAALRVEAATVRYHAAVAESGPKSLAARQAYLDLAAAQNTARTSTAGVTKAQGDTVTSLGRAIAATRAQQAAAQQAVTIATQQNAVIRRSGTENTSAAATYRSNSKAIEENGQKAEAAGKHLTTLQQRAATAAGKIKGVGPAADSVRAALGALAKADVGQLTNFAANVRKSVKGGATAADAVGGEIERILSQLDASPSFAGFLASIDSAGASAVSKSAAIGAKVRANLSKASADAHGSPSANELMDRSLQRTAKIIDARGSTIVTSAGKVAAGVHRELAKASGTIDLNPIRVESALRAIDVARTAIEKRQEATRVVRERKRLEADVGRAKDAAARTAAATALADFNRDQRQARALLPTERARKALDDFTSARDRALSQASDVVTKTTSAIADRFARLSAAIDTAAGIVTQGIEDGGKSAAQVIDELARTSPTVAANARKAFATIPPAVRAAFDGIAANLRTALAPIDAELGAAKARVDAIGAELDASQRAREDRDAATRASEAAADRSAAQAKLARLQEIAKRARTASEQAAAGTLVAAAQGELAKAVAAEADVADQAHTTALERERTALQARADVLQTSRDAEVEKARNLTALLATEQTAALEAKRVQLTAALERELALYTSNLEKGGPAARKAAAGNLKQIRALLGDPAAVASLRDSGERMGKALANGLTAAQGEVAQAAAGLAAVIARYLRTHSPAKVGPLAYDQARSAQVIGTDLAKGLRRSVRTVRIASASVADAATVHARQDGALASTSASLAALAAAGGGGDRISITVPAERPVEDPRSTAARLRWELRQSGRR